MGQIRVAKNVKTRWKLFGLDESKNGEYSTQEKYFTI
jgi:hypothetical protein